MCPCVRIEFPTNSRSSHTGVPIHVSGVPVHFGYCHFSAQVYRYMLKVYRYTLPIATFPALLQFPKLHQSVANILNDPYLLPGHKSLYNYALYLKDLYKSKKTQKQLKVPILMQNVGKVRLECAKFCYTYCSIMYSSHPPTCILLVPSKI